MEFIGLPRSLHSRVERRRGETGQSYLCRKCAAFSGTGKVLVNSRRSSHLREPV